eukprot:9699246-Prorocentrum_lima.AAC.1
MPRDGACLFHAVATLLSQTRGRTISAVEVRQYMVNKAAEEPLAPLVAHQVEDANKWLTSMAQ